MSSLEQDPPQGRVVLVRHGQTEWSKSGQHTGLSDIPLTARGEAEAEALGNALQRFDIVRTLTSPLQRAARTAELAGLTSLETDANLLEWDYGAYDGLTTAQIRSKTGTSWDIWSDGVVPGNTPGETLEQVADRCARAIDSIRDDLARGDVVFVAHAHLLRVLTTVWLGQDPRLAAHLYLDSGSLSLLGNQRETPVLLGWNHTSGDGNIAAAAN